MSTLPSPKSVLFVCLGNICRSPLGEGIFRNLVEEEGLSDDFTIDSCGTGAYHIGNPPHKDSQRVALANGFSIAEQKARQVKKSDYEKFDYIVAMDFQNKNDLIDLFEASEKILTLREHDPSPDSKDVPDPYFGGPEGFEVVYDIIDRSCRQFLQKLKSA